MQPVKIAIIVPLYGKLDLTKKMLASIPAAVAPNHSYTLFLVDNCSPDNTAQWLIDEAKRLYPAEVVLLGKNTGFAGGVNAGLRAALKYDIEFTHFLVANNDVVVPKGTISQLVDFMGECPSEVGVVGPISNAAGGVQCWEHGYGNPLPAGVSLEDHARLRCDKYRGADLEVRAREAFAIVGLFFLMSRSFFLATGFFDERYFPGMWEESDLCLRGHLAGFRFFVDQMSFVWHEGSSTMKDMKLDTDATFKKNRGLYLAKWGAALTAIGREIVRVNKEVGMPDPELPVRIALQKAFY